MPIAQNNIMYEFYLRSQKWNYARNIYAGADIYHRRFNPTHRRHPPLLPWVFPIHLTNPFRTNHRR